MRHIEEFSSGATSVRLPPRRDVPLSGRITDVIDHPVFQRLRRVRQLGPLSLIYPGGTHSRFEHSIGVYGVAIEYLRALMRDPLAASLTEADIQVCLLAALLHDLGHYPYAHNLEASHVGSVHMPRHEELAADLMYGRLSVGDSAGGTLASLIERRFDVSADAVIGLIAAPASSHGRAERRLVASVISSGIDADKSDYLERDAYHMGLPFGEQFDRQRMLSTLVVHPNEDRIALTMSGRMAAESFVFARYAMFSEAYWHHTARAVAAMVEEALRDVQRQTPWEHDALVRQIIQQDDEEFLSAMRARARPGSAADILLSALTGGHRRMYKRVLTLTLAYSNPSLRTAYDRIYVLDRERLDLLRRELCAVIEAVIGRRVQPWELLIDTPPRDKDHVEPIDVVRDGIIEPLADRSQIMRGIASDFVKVVKKIRVFVAPDIRAAMDAQVPRRMLERRLVEAILDFRVETTPQQHLFDATR